jgi:hypothetical protein
MERMKINLCCGDDVREGYIGIDARKTNPNILDLEKELVVCATKRC